MRALHCLLIFDVFTRFSNLLFQAFLLERGEVCTMHSFDFVTYVCKFSFFVVVFAGFQNYIRTIMPV